MAESPWLLFLSPDCIITVDQIQRMLAWAKQHHEYGLVSVAFRENTGCNVPPISLSYPGHRYGSSQFHILPGSVAWVSGDCMWMPQKHFRQLKGFDESLPGYGAVMDLCLRVRQLGHPIGCNRDIAIESRKSSAGEPLPESDPWKELVESETLFARKHLTPANFGRWRRSQERNARWVLLLLNLCSGLLPFSRKFWMDARARSQAILEATG